MLEVAGGKADAVGDTQRWCSPARTVVTSQDLTREIGELGNTWRSEESWAVMDTGTDSLLTGQRVELCQALVKNGMHRQEEFTRKRALSCCLRNSRSGWASQEGEGGA